MTAHARPLDLWSLATALGIPTGDACYPLELVRLPEQERDARRDARIDASIIALASLGFAAWLVQEPQLCGVNAAKAIRLEAWSKRCSPFAITVNMIIDIPKII